MKQLGRLSFAILAVALVSTQLIGCASGPAPTPRMSIEPQRFDSDFDNTWNAVNDVLTEKRFPIKTIEKESGLVATETVSSGARYIFWGMKDDSGREISTWADKTRYFVNIRVRRRDDGGITVDVLPHVEYMRYEYSAALKRSIEAGWEACESHGDIEKDIYDALKAKLGK